MTRLIITKPDDWHIHLRSGEFLKTTVPHAARQFEKIIVMPNLQPPICQTQAALNYREEILGALPSGAHLQPLMTLYLTDATLPDEIEKAKHSGMIVAGKLYPAGSTTHSDGGVQQLKKLYPALEKMQQLAMPLLIHGEVTDKQVDIFDREAKFLDRILAPLIKDFPDLRIVLEHITTSEAVEFVQAHSKNLAATITPHHLLMNRNDIFTGGIRPHHYCLPILKRRAHQQALIKAVTSGQPQFFLGTDSAPHSLEHKENHCGCAGIYSAHAAIELYCEVFEQAKALDKLEGFASFHGADFYRLPRNSSQITLVKEDWTVPPYYSYADSKLIPFRAGEVVHWKLKRL